MGTASSIAKGHERTIPKHYETIMQGSLSKADKSKLTCWAYCWNGSGTKFPQPGNKRVSHSWDFVDASLFNGNGYVCTKRFIDITYNHIYFLHFLTSGRDSTCFTRRFSFCLETSKPFSSALRTVFTDSTASQVLAVKNPEKWPQNGKILSLINSLQLIRVNL